MQPQRLHREVEGGRRRVDRYGVARADRLAEALLELLHSRACRQPAGSQDRHDFVDLGLPDVRAKIGNGRFLHPEPLWHPAGDDPRGTCRHRFQKRTRPARKPNPYETWSVA
jgi:hypothetical protein